MEQNKTVKGSADASEFRENTVHGPYWNPVSAQFMYAPTFRFQPIPGFKKYRFDLKDTDGAIHSFLSDNATATMETVWDEIPEGVTTVTAYALNEDESEFALVGARTFYRVAPFCDHLPQAVCPYEESARRAYEYLMSRPILKHWLEDGKPDPEYNYYVYPSKMYREIIIGMLKYADMCPDKADDALKIAKAAADYLLGISFGKGSPIEGLPPTYNIDFRPDPENRKNLAAEKRLNTIMMVYPPTVGTAYFKLYDKVGDKKYYDAAMKIGEYYRDHVEQNNGWYLIRDVNTGEHITDNYCIPLREIMPFVMDIYERTGDEVWKKLSDNALEYVENEVLPRYDWEGQFEDSPVSESYSNLSHYGANALAMYYAEHYSDDENRMKTAEELVRFTEDQFVIWKNPAPWSKQGYDTKLWHTPCGLEQYNWHVPIDASTTNMMMAFVALYKAGRGDIYLKKAKALADSLTRAQQPDGLIPTHWMTEKHMQGKSMWLNCMLYAANGLVMMSKIK